MGEENRTLTTEYPNAVLEIKTSDGGQLEIPKYAIDRMAKYFLHRMQDEAQKCDKND